MDGRVKTWALAVVFALLAMVPFVLQRGTLNKVRAENDRLNAQMQELRRELARATTNSAQSTNQQGMGSLPNEQFLELMRLRREVTVLRAYTNSLAGAIPATAKRPAPAPAPDMSQTGVTDGRPPDVAAGGPPWTFKGYSTPNDTIASYIWALEQGRMDMILGSATPEAQSRMQAGFQSATNAVERMQAEARKVLEVKPSAAHPGNANEVYFTMVVEEPAQQAVVAQNPAGHDASKGAVPLPAGTTFTQGSQRRETTVRLQRVGGEWRLADSPEGRIGLQH